MSAPVIDASGLGRDYGATVGLRTLDLSIAPGALIGILGPNGAGKTTAMLLLATLLTPSRGTARVFGHDTVRERAAVRRRLGLVFQEPSLDGLLTVRENLRFAAGLMGLGGRDARRAVHEAIERTGLTSQADRPARQLSGGWRRLTDIARAMLHRPDLLILDEPTVGLDPEHRDRTWSLLDAERRERGVTVLFSTHYLAEAEGCDHAFMLARGEVVAADAPAALRARFGNQVVEIEGPDAESAAGALQQTATVRTTLRTERGYRIGIDGEPNVAALVVSAPRLTRLDVRRASLEDVYFAMTREAARPERAHEHRHGDPETRRLFGLLRLSVPSRPISRDLRSRSDLSHELPSEQRESTGSRVATVTAIVRRDLLRTIRQKSRIVGGLARPFMWLLLVGTGYNAIARVDGAASYQAFVFPGLVVMSALFGGMLTAISTVYDREFGMLRLMLASPSGVPTILAGRALAATAVGALQGAVVLACAPLLISVGPSTLAAAAAVLVLTAFVSSVLGLLIAAPLRSIENFAGIINVVLFPLLFLSGALYPVRHLPLPLHVAARANPVTYAVDLMRGALGQPTELGAGVSITVLLIVTAGAFVAAAWLFDPEQRIRKAPTPPGAARP